MKKLICTILIFLSCIMVKAESDNHFGVLFTGDIKEHYGFSILGNVDHFSLGCDAKFSRRNETLLGVNLGVYFAKCVYVMGTVGFAITPNSPVSSSWDRIDFGAKAVFKIPAVPIAISAGWTRFGYLNYGIGIYF